MSQYGPQAFNFELSACWLVPFHDVSEVAMIYKMI
jgi:hypothetical protein